MLGFILPIANLVPQLQPQAGTVCFGPHGFFSEKIGIFWIHDVFFMKKTCKILGFLGFVDFCFGDCLIEKRFWSLDLLFFVFYGSYHGRSPLIIAPTIWDDFCWNFFQASKDFANPRIWRLHFSIKSWLGHRLVFLILSLILLSLLCLDGGFKDLLFSPLPGEDSHFDEYFSFRVETTIQLW